jgi:sec-independent protein translocase protein TatC
VSEPEHKSEQPELTDDTPPPPAREKPMGFWDHLEELRWTLVKSAVVFTVFAVLIGIYMKEFNGLLMWPFDYAKSKYPSVSMELGVVTIMEPFNVVIQMCVLGGGVLAAPFILFFIGQFVTPALNEREIKAVTPIIISAAVLFLLGSAFSFFVLVPNTIGVSVEISQMLNYTLRWTPGSYFSLLTWLVLGVGASFEFPLVIVLLVWLGIMSTAFLRKYRRHAFVVIFIIAAIVTPTPDPITQIFFAIPLYLLYEIAILVGARVEKNREARMKMRFDA